MTYTTNTVVVTDNPDSELNTRGEEFASTVNSLIDLVDGTNRHVVPPINTSVVTASSYDPTEAYSFGDEIRTGIYFAKCIQAITASEDHNVNNQNYWHVFYLPGFPEYPYSGSYYHGKRIPEGTTVQRIVGNEMYVYLTLQNIFEQPLTDELSFRLLETYTLV